MLAATSCSELGSADERADAIEVTTSMTEQLASSITEPTTEPIAEPTTEPATEPDSTTNTTTEPPVAVEPLAGSYEPRVVATFPHDASAYTQGLELVDGVLVESTGRYEQSDRRIVELATGTVLDSADLADEFFGEGLTVVGDELFQLTWRSERFVVADVATLDEIRTGTYNGEGWGLCHDGDRFVMSDGSDILTFRDTDSFEPIARISVQREGQPIALINELECVNGQVIANVYRSDEIIVIDPDSGAVVASIDASALRPPALPLDDADFALNGIAFDEATGHFYVTGKWWPVLYEVEFVPS